MRGLPLHTGTLDMYRPCGCSPHNGGENPSQGTLARRPCGFTAHEGTQLGTQPGAPLVKGLLMYGTRNPANRHKRHEHGRGWIRPRWASGGEWRMGPSQAVTLGDSTRPDSGRRSLWVTPSHEVSDEEWNGDMGRSATLGSYYSRGETMTTTRAIALGCRCPRTRLQPTFVTGTT